jgi:hypothetical protein
VKEGRKEGRKEGTNEREKMCRVCLSVCLSYFQRSGQQGLAKRCTELHRKFSAVEREHLSNNEKVVVP